MPITVTTEIEYTILEIFLRILALVVLGMATGFIFASLRRGTLRPRPIWIYVGVIAFLTLIWRAIVLAFVFSSSLREDFVQWISPMTATMYALGGLSLLLLAFCATRRRRGDE